MFLSACRRAKHVEANDLAAVPLTRCEMRNAITIATVQAVRVGESFTTKGLEEACRIVVSERLEDPFLGEARSQRSHGGIGFCGTMLSPGYSLPSHAAEGALPDRMAWTIAYIRFVESRGF